MVEVKEVVRLWLGDVGKKEIAARLGLDPKRVRGYIGAAQALGRRREGGSAPLSFWSGFPA